MLGVTPGDLYVPALTFVFGEAQLDGACCTRSSTACPARGGLLRERLVKEGTHEFGHTFDLLLVWAASDADEWKNRILEIPEP